MELPQNDVCYRALESRDARFDGLIFVGVTSTGVYCRPVCPVRTPKFQNCRFFSSAAAAQDAGFRPCMRCRPETAPDLASWRGTSNSVSRALALIAEGALDGAGSSVEKLAGRLGLGERQLRRLFLQHLGASPISVAQTRRVLFAKQLIQETRMPMAQVALAAGFGSLRRFNETFLDLFRRPPSALRRANVGRDEESGKDVTLRLRYRPPYDWESVLAFLSARAVPGVELVDGARYLRSVEIDGRLGSIEVTHLPERQSLGVRIRFPEVRSLPGIVARVRRLFDLSADIETIARHLSGDPVLAPLVAERPGLRAPGGWDGFETAMRAVLGQQITVSAARRLAGRLAEQHGRAVPRAFRIHPDICRAFPAAKRLRAPLQLGMPAARLETLRALAQAAVADPGLFQPVGDIDLTVARLRKIRGIGEWSAQYIALRAAREMDAFPVTDLGILRGARTTNGANTTPANLLRRAEAWRPWRAYAAQHLWAAGSNTVKEVSA